MTEPRTTSSSSAARQLTRISKPSAKSTKPSSSSIELAFDQFKSLFSRQIIEDEIVVA